MTKAMATYIDQSHAATNATGDSVAATCVSVTEGTLDCTAPACIDEVKNNAADLVFLCLAKQTVSLYNER